MRSHLSRFAGIAGCFAIAGMTAVQADEPDIDSVLPLRLIAGIEAGSPPAIPTRDGHLVIRAARSRVYLPPGTYAELAPSLRQLRPDFGPVDSYLLINERLTGAAPDSESPRPFSRYIDANGRNGSTIKRFALGVLNSKNRAQELMRCTVHAADPGPRLKIQAEDTNDTARIHISERGSLGAVYLFVNQNCIGKLTDKTDTAALDTRQTPPGTYTVAALAETEDGILLPVVTKTLTVRARYEVDILNGEEPIRIPFDQPNPALPIRVYAADGMDVAVTCVYLNGHFIGESRKPAFEMAIPLRNAPLGKATLQIIGTAKDGAKYPAETRVLQIENDTDGFYAAAN